VARSNQTINGAAPSLAALARLPTGNRARPRPADSSNKSSGGVVSEPVLKAAEICARAKSASHSDNAELTMMKGSPRGRYRLCRRIPASKLIS
jgi:hypothetical protein